MFILGLLVRQEVLADFERQLIINLSLDGHTLFDFDLVDSVLDYCRIHLAGVADR